jgi:hypothetical protein
MLAILIVALPAALTECAKWSPLGLAINLLDINRSGRCRAHDIIEGAEFDRVGWVGR